TLLIPILAGVLKFRIAGNPFRGFMFLLIYGFFTDLLVWQLLERSRATSLFLFNIYSLVESMFYFWFIMVTNEGTAIRKICRLLTVFAITLWLIIYFRFQDEQPHMT